MTERWRNVGENPYISEMWVKGDTDYLLADPLIDSNNELAVLLISGFVILMIGSILTNNLKLSQTIYYNVYAKN